MTLVRRPLIGLLALFVGALLIDRLALAGAADQTMQTGTYLAALAAVAAPLALRGMRRLRLVSFLMLTAAGMGIFQTWAGRITSDPYLSLVETAFVILTAALSHRLADGFDRLDQTINSVVFGESPALPLDGRQAATEILGEMARSRRHHRPLSVTVLAPDPSTMEIAVDLAAEEVQRAVRARYVQSKLARIIADQLRRSDLLFEDPATGNFVVVSPETSSDGTSLLIGRIQRAIATTRVRLGAGQATFPEHALTFEQLVEHAQEHIADRSHPAADPGRVREEGAA